MAIRIDFPKEFRAPPSRINPGKSEDDLTNVVSFWLKKPQTDEELYHAAFEVLAEMYSLHIAQRRAGKQSAVLAASRELREFENATIRLRESLKKVAGGVAFDKRQRLSAIRSCWLIKITHETQKLRLMENRYGSEMEESFTQIETTLPMIGREVDTFLPHLSH